MGHCKPTPAKVNLRAKADTTQQLPCNLLAHQVPISCKKPFLIAGYRPPNYCFKQCVQSLFYLHNETMDSWTHIVACVYFLYKVYMCVFGNGDFQPNIVPLMISGLGGAILFAASSVAHTFNPLSVIWRQRLFLIDYAAISFSASGCIVAYQAYLPKDTMLYHSKNIYVITSCIGSWVGIVGSSLTMVTCQGVPMLRVLNTISYTIVAVLGNLCMIKYCISNPSIDVDQEIHDKICWLFLIYVLLLLASGFVNSSCLPERLSPGKFDCIAHSHQVFHVVVFLAYAVQFEIFDIMRENNHTGTFGYDELVRAYYVVGVSWPIYLITALGFYKAVDRSFGPGTVFASIPKTPKAQD